MAQQLQKTVDLMAPHPGWRRVLLHDLLRKDLRTCAVRLGKNRGAHAARYNVGRLMLACNCVSCKPAQKPLDKCSSPY